MKTKLFFTGLVLMASISFMNAQGNGCRNGSGNGTCNGTGKGASYVDANKDGKCDNANTTQAGVKKGKHQGNSTAAKKGTGQGKHLQNGTGTCVNTTSVAK